MPVSLWILIGLSVVVLLPGFLGAILRIFCRRVSPDLLAGIIALGLLIFDFWLNPDHLTVMLDAFADFESSSAIGFAFAGFMLLIQVVILSFIARLGIRVTDKLRGPQAGRNSLAC